jgi:hypothetical protein
MRDCNINDVSFVKLDCEGCEYELVPKHSHFFDQAFHLVGEVHAWQIRPRGGKLDEASVSKTEKMLCRRFRRTKEKLKHLNCR